MISIINRLIMGSDKNIMRKSVIWNVISSVEYSAQSMLLLIVVTRVGGLFFAGIFNVAYTLAQMMSTIGSYAMRSFQVSDTKEEYTFAAYFNSRIVSTVAMTVICMSCAAFRKYGVEKMSVTACMCGYRVIEVMEDVFHGEIQKRNRFDVAEKIASVRIFATTLIFMAAYIISESLVISSLIFMLSALVLSLTMNLCVIKEFKGIKIIFSFAGVFKLLLVCLPICASGFLYNYLANAPKYAVDRNVSEDMQAVFSILFMPLFVINVMSSFIFKPMIAGMGVMWNNEEYGKFIKTVVKQILILTGITLLIMAGGALIGIDILGWIFGIDLTKYRFLFTIMMLFGGLSAVAAFMAVALTIMRRQNYIIAAYGVAVAADLLFIDTMVRGFSLVGAGVMYGVSMGIVAAMLLTVFIATMRKRQCGMRKIKNRK